MQHFVRGEKRMSDIPREVGDHISPLVIVVSKKEVLDRNIEPALNVLRSLMESPEISKVYKENVKIIFFFLSKEYLGLQNMVHCFFPPFRTDKGKRELFPERIGNYLRHRWLPAMSDVCKFAGCSEEEINELADRGVRYIESGRFNNCGYH
jgi:hypothetical protein